MVDLDTMCKLHGEDMRAREIPAHRRNVAARRHAMIQTRAESTRTDSCANVDCVWQPARTGHGGGQTAWQRVPSSALQARNQAPLQYSSCVRVESRCVTARTISTARRDPRIVWYGSAHVLKGFEDPLQTHVREEPIHSSREHLQHETDAEARTRLRTKRDSLDRSRGCTKDTAEERNLLSSSTDRCGR